MAATLWTAEQLAHYLQISVETVWRYTREGKLPAIKLGNHYRYPVDEAIDALRSAGEAAGRRMTYEEFCRLPEQPGLQLIDGFLVKEPSPRYGHQAVIGDLYFRIVAHVKEHRLGEAILAPFDVVLADDQVLQPDIMFISAGRRRLIKERGVFGAPDLVVEVLSPSTRRYDEGRKRELYFEHGCSEMWIVDSDELTVVHGVRGEAGWKDALLKRGDILVSPTLRGFRLSIEEIAPAFDPS